MTQRIETFVLPIFSSSPVEEVVLPNDAVGLSAKVVERNLTIEIDYMTEGQPPMPRRVLTARAGMQANGVRHLISYEWVGVAWHVFVEVDQE